MRAHTRYTRKNTLITQTQHVQTHTVIANIHTFLWFTFLARTTFRTLSQLPTTHATYAPSLCRVRVAELNSGTFPALRHFATPPQAQHLLSVRSCVCGFALVVVAHFLFHLLIEHSFTTHNLSLFPLRRATGTAASATSSQQLQTAICNNNARRRSLIISKKCCFTYLQITTKSARNNNKKVKTTSATLMHVGAQQQQQWQDQKRHRSNILHIQPVAAGIGLLRRRVASIKNCKLFLRA